MRDASMTRRAGQRAEPADSGPSGVLLWRRIADELEQSIARGTFEPGSKLPGEVDIAERFGVSVASVVKWAQRFRATGSAAAKPMGGRRPYALEGERSWVLARVSEAPELTLRALAAELAERGIAVSHYAVWHFLVREGITFKKKPARQRAGSPRRRPAARAMAALPRPA